MEQRVGEKELNREFQHFLDGAIHGFRARLREIGTSAAMFSRQWNERLDEEGREFLARVQQGVSELDSFTKALSDYALAVGGPNTSKTLTLPVENAVQTAIANQRQRIQQSGASVYSGPMPRLEADHEELGVLFRCLLSNALEYVRDKVPARIEITATAAGDEWRFAVSDNGMGIAPRFHRQVFEPFQRLQSDRRGFGLGLAIARKIVNSHGGRIWVDSQEDEGSTFFFTLPMMPASA